MATKVAPSPFFTHAAPLPGQTSIAMATVHACPKCKSDHICDLDGCDYQHSIDCPKCGGPASHAEGLEERVEFSMLWHEAQQEHERRKRHTLGHYHACSNRKCRESWACKDPANCKEPYSTECGCAVQQNLF